MATVERTASGWEVTVNGREIELSDLDLGSDPQFPRLLPHLSPRWRGGLVVVAYERFYENS